MAKVCMIERDKKRKKLVGQYAKKRAALKAIIKNKDVPADERFQAQLTLDKLPRNSSKIRMRNRCSVTGRPRSYYRKLSVSRIALRDLASRGELPGVMKSSW